MNEFTVDFSTVSARKLSHALSNIDFSVKTVPKDYKIPAPRKSTKHLPHELRKAITVLKLIEASGQHSSEELEPMHRKIEALKLKFHISQN